MIKDPPRIRVCQLFDNSLLSSKSHGLTATNKFLTVKMHMIFVSKHSQSENMSVAYMMI